MIEIAAQMRKGIPYPFSQEDMEALKEYKENQIIRMKTYGVQKERSLRQFRMFHGVLRTVVANTEHPDWCSLPKAKFRLKVELHFVDEGVTAVDKHGVVRFSYRSFGYADLPHMEACNVFSRSWPILAKVIGVSEDKLLENVEL